MTAVDPFVLALAGKYDGLDARVCEVSCAWDVKELKVSGRFFYLTFRNGQPTVEDFAGFVFNQAIAFCIPRKDREEKLAAFATDGNTRHLMDLSMKARNLFVRAAKSQSTVGEPGELVLFLLNEAFLGAPQIVCKMYLKTSENVPVHGSDSVHVRWDATQQQLVLYWGESKLYQVLPSAFDEILDSIETFMGDPGSRAARERDIDVLRDHTNIADPATRKAVLDFFDPYSNKSNQRREAFACFAGFSFEKLGQLSAKTDAELKQEFEKLYKERVETACALFEKKVRAKKLTHLEFALFLIPFPDVDGFRAAFATAMGL
jgi:hypothetical protein